MTVNRGKRSVANHQRSLVLVVETVFAVRQTSVASLVRLGRQFFLD